MNWRQSELSGGFETNSKTAQGKKWLNLIKTEVENMGASNEEICQEILEGQFAGVQLTFIFSNKTFLFLTHMVKFYHTYSTSLVGFSVYLD